MTTTILLVEDGEVFVYGLRSILTIVDEFSIVDAAATVQDAKAKVEALKPDMVVVDLRIPPVPDMPADYVHGIDLIRHLCERYPDLPILTISSTENEKWMIQAMKAGAAGFVSKDQPEETLIDALRALRRGQAIWPRHVLRNVLGAKRAVENPLTEREVDVLRLIAQGLNNREIAQRLRVSEGTVRAHVTHILNKLNAPSRYAAVHRARTRGIEV